MEDRICEKWEKNWLALDVVCVCVFDDINTQRTFN